MTVSDRVILRGGPRHRWVYPREDLLKFPPPGYVETDEFRALGTIYHGLSQAAGGEAVRVWKWEGVEAPPADPTIAPRIICTYRTCTRRATFTISGETGGDWLGCDEHAPAMAKSFEIGQRIDYTVKLRPINARTVLTLR